jgi:hypothetical protein
MAYEAFLFTHVITTMCVSHQGNDEFGADNQSVSGRVLFPLGLAGLLDLGKFCYSWHQSADSIVWFPTLVH